MKITRLLGFIMLIGILSSCMKKQEDLKYLPNNTNLVLTFTPSNLQQKSGILNIADTKTYKSFVNNLDSSKKVIFSQFDYIFKNYQESGIDITKPIFLFNTSQHNGYQKNMGINFRLTDSQKFDKLIQKIVDNTSDSLKLIKDGDLNLLIPTNTSHQKLLAWNNTAVLAIEKTKGKGTRVQMIEYIHKLFNQKASSSLASNKDFVDFYNQRKDISLWLDSKYLMQKLPVEYQTFAKMQMPINMENIYLHYFVQFDNGEINISSELKLPDELKDFLSDYKIIKPHIDKKMIGFIPNKSLMNISFAIKPTEILRMIRDLYSERQIDTKGMEKLFEMATNIKIEKLFKSISGDMIINIHGVKLVNINNSNNHKKAIWQFSSVFKLDDEKIYNWLIDKLSENKELAENNYYILNKTKYSSLYISMSKGYVMLTNDKSIIESFSENKILQKSLLTNKIANKIENYSAYAQINLDYSEYPQEVQEYFESEFERNHKIPFKRKVSQIRFEPIDSYSAQLIIEFKNKAQNSLKQMIAD